MEPLDTALMLRTGISGISNLVGRYFLLISIVVLQANCERIDPPIPVVPTEQVPPVAFAGKDTSIASRGGIVTTLDGSASRQGSVPIVKYVWSKISGPEVKFYDTLGVSISVQLQDTGIYVFQLQVKDRNGLSSTAKVTVTLSFDSDCNRGGTVRNLERTFEVPGYQTYLGASESKFYFINIVQDLTGFGDDQTELKVLDWTQKKWLSFSYPHTDLEIDDFYATENLAFFHFRALRNNPPYTMAILDLSDGSWTLSFLSDQRSQLTIARAGNKVFFGGGRTFYDYSDQIDIYDLPSKSWTTSKLSRPKSDMVALSVDGKICFAGGSAALGASRDIEVIDVVTGARTIHEMREGRAQFTGWVNDGKVYCAGGAGLNGVLYSIEILDLKTGTFSYDCLNNRQYWESSRPAITVAKGHFIPIAPFARRIQEYTMMTPTGSWWSGSIQNDNISVNIPFAFASMGGELIQVSADYSVPSSISTTLKFYRMSL
jgi:hypothetical protein